jgi:glycosyltransferase involved in cell wall biosynthesis
MKVSIAISTYEANGRGVELLSVNINTIMQQTYKNIEIVISDHSANADIQNYIDSVRSKCQYDIIYVHNPEKHGNISHNINNAINYCTGDIIKIIFMDDFLLKSTAIADIAFVFTQYPYTKWLVNSYLHTQNYSSFYNPIYPKYNDQIITGRNTIGCPSGLTISKDVNVRFDENLKWFMDCEYYYQLFKLYGGPIIYQDDFLVGTLIHNAQVTNSCVNNDALINSETSYINAKYGLTIVRT